VAVNNIQFKNSKRKRLRRALQFQPVFQSRTVCHFLCKLFWHLKMCCLGLFFFIHLIITGRGEQHYIISLLSCTLHHIIIIFWSKFIYIKIISTCPVIDMNLCCLIKFHVDMLTLLNRFLIKQTMQKVRMKNVFVFSMWKQLRWMYFIFMHGTQSFFLKLLLFVNRKLYIFVWFFCNYVDIMWDLYAQRPRGTNVKVCYNFDNDEIVFFKTLNNNESWR
jgi:hypothetical protein